MALFPNLQKMASEISGKSKSKKRGRPFNGSTQFPGIIEVSRLIGRSPGHIRSVLTGERKSRALLTTISKAGHSLSALAKEILKNA